MPRARSTTVSGSPPLAAETAICTVLLASIPLGDQIDFDYAIDITIGTSGTGASIQLRRGIGTGGASVGTNGPFTVVAANRVTLSGNFTDQQPTEQYNQSYTLTATITAGAAVSTVNNVYLGAIW